MPWVIDSELKVDGTLVQTVMVNNSEVYTVECTDTNGVKHIVFHKYWESGGGGSGRDELVMANVESGVLAFGIINHDYNDELTEKFSVLEFSTAIHDSLASTYNFNRTTAEGSEEEVDVAQMILNFFCCIMQLGYSKLDGIQTVLDEALSDGTFDQIMEKYQLGNLITGWINEWITAATKAGTYTEEAYQTFITTTTDAGDTTLKDKMNDNEYFAQAREDFMNLIAEKLGITVPQLQNGNW